MSRERDSLNGALLIHKPIGLTSHDVVAKLRKLLKTKAIGHAGTLDPMAEGLLVLLVGEATKVSSLITAQDKDYVANIDFGYTTDTQDAEGLVTSKAQACDLSLEQITNEAKKLRGSLDLEVPIYSAIKVKGKKLYDYAREGREITPPMRSMHFYEVDVLSASPRQAQIRLKCEKGAYIRSWVSQLGANLGVGATMTALVRNQSGRFKLEDSLSLSNLEKSSEEAKSLEAFIREVQNQKFFISLEDCLHGDFFRLSGFEAHLMRNGQIPKSLNQRLVPVVHDCLKTSETRVLKVYESLNAIDSLLALIEVSASRPKPKILRVFKST